MTAEAMTFASELIAADLLEVASRWVSRLREAGRLAEDQATIAVARGVIDLAVTLLVGTGMAADIAAQRIASCAAIAAGSEADG